MKGLAAAEIFLLVALCLLAFVVWKQQEELSLLGQGLGRLENGQLDAPPVPPAPVDGTGEVVT